MAVLLCSSAHEPWVQNQDSLSWKSTLSYSFLVDVMDVCDQKPRLCSGKPEVTGA